MLNNVKKFCADDFKPPSSGQVVNYHKIKHFLFIDFF